MSTNRASGLSGVQNNLPNNTQRLITEEIMRNELSKLWNSTANLIDDDFRFNLRQYEDRAYKIGEGAFFDGKLYKANDQVTGGAFDPSKWDQVGSSGVKSFKTRTGDVSPASGDYDSDQITNKSTKAQGVNVTQALDFLYDLATQGAINSFFVNSNNPNSGDGSISNPFNSIDLAYNTILGSGTPLNPEFAPLGDQISIIVQGGSYQTNKNLLLRRVSWVFELGSLIDFTGTGALFYTDQAIFGNPSNEIIEFFVLGDGNFVTGTGSFFKTSMGNLSGGGRLTLRGIRFTSTKLSSDSDESPLFDLDNNGDNSFQFPSSFDMFLDSGTRLSSLTQTILKSGNSSSNSGRKICQITNGSFSLGNASSQNTMSASASCVKINRTQGSIFTNCTFTAYKAEYLVQLSGSYRKISFRSCKFLTSANSQAVKSKGAVKIFDGFTPNSDGGGSSATLICEFNRCDVSDNNFSTNELFVFTGSGDLNTLLLNNCFLTGGISQNIKIAKSISFTGNGSNPSTVNVTNVINKKITISNLEENNQVSRQVFVDDNGVLFYKIGSGSGNSFQFGLNESGGVVELGGEAKGKSLSIYSDSTSGSFSEAQDFVIGFNLDNISTNDIFDNDEAFRSFTVITDATGTSEIINATNVGDLISTLTLVSRSKISGQSSFLSSDNLNMRLSTVKDFSSNLLINRSNTGTRISSINGFAEAFLEVYGSSSNIGGLKITQDQGGIELITQIQNAFLELGLVNQNDNNTKILSINTVTDRVEWVDKSTISGGTGGSKKVIKYDFVKSGNVATQVTLEAHSSFAGSSPILLPSGIISAKIVGFNVLTGTSVATQGTTATFQVRTQSKFNNALRPYGGGVLRYTNTQLSTNSAQGTRYYETVSDPNLFGNPVTIGVNDLVFIDLNPLFWQFSDINCNLFIEVEI